MPLADWELILYLNREIGENITICYFHADEPEHTMNVINRIIAQSSRQGSLIGAIPPLELPQ